MRHRAWMFAAAALLSALATPHAFADDDDEKYYVVRVKGDRYTIDQICARLSCDVVRALNASSNNVFLVAPYRRGDAEDFLEHLEETKEVIGVERVRRTVIPEAPRGLIQKDPSVAFLNGLTDTRLVDYHGDKVWRGYVSQPAVKIVRMADAQKNFDVSGAGIVAIIDTGIDPEHPALKQWITPGYDFTRDVATVPSELADLNQSTVAVLNQSTVAVLNQSTVAVLNQSTVAVLNDPNFKAFGHGTMVAGIIHLVAPRAKLMPLKVFRPDGTAQTSDIVRAIYYAVDHGAKVINMSFSLNQVSVEIMRAVNYASRRGVTCVASVGNEGKDALVFPAAYGNVLSVAATTALDLRAPFSNHNEDMVWVAAPGEGIITTFPGSSYAAAWGTSFSAAFVSGAVALFVDVDINTNAAQAGEALSHAKSVSKELGFGRLDLYEAVRAHRNSRKGD